MKNNSVGLFLLCIIFYEHYDQHTWNDPLQDPQNCTVLTEETKVVT